MLSQKDMNTHRETLYSEIKETLLDAGKEIHRVEEGLAIEVAEGEYAIIKVIVKKEFDLEEALEVMEQKASEKAKKEAEKAKKVAKAKEKEKKEEKEEGAK